MSLLQTLQLSIQVSLVSAIVVVLRIAVLRHLPAIASVLYTAEEIAPYQPFTPQMELEAQQETDQ
jgi:hypothetical protein